MESLEVVLRAIQLLGGLLIACEWVDRHFAAWMVRQPPIRRGRFVRHPGLRRQGRGQLECQEDQARQRPAPPAELFQPVDRERRQNHEAESRENTEARVDAQRRRHVADEP